MYIIIIIIINTWIIINEGDVISCITWTDFLGFDRIIAVPPALHQKALQ